MGFWYLFLAILTLPAWGTTFMVQSVDRQLTEADGVIVGNFLRKESIKLESGIIATQMIFELKKEWGLQSDLFAMQEVIVHFPGGTWKDHRVEVAGVPSFVVGEKVVLLAKSVNNRFWGLNLGMGTFKLINYGNETMLINSIFPTNPIVGQVKLEDFEAKVKKLKGSSLKVVYMPALQDTSGPERRPASLEEGKNRAIASKSEEVDNRGDQSGPSVYWLVVLLALAAGFSRYLGRGKA